MKDTMIYDVHTHLWLARREHDERALLRAVERFGITRLFISGLHGYTPDQETVREINRTVADYTKKHSDCMSGYVYVSPELPDAMDTLRRGIEEQGMVGVKFWASSLCDSPCVYPLAEKIIAYGVPLLAHSFYKARGIGQFVTESTAVNVAALAKRYPSLKLIMAHLGGNCYHGLPAISGYPNVWCDFSGSIFRGDELNYALSKIGAERILFGTDMPGSFVTKYGQVLEANFTPEQRALVLYQNALRVFDTHTEGGKCL